MNTYRAILESDEFEIFSADSDEEAISEALNTYSDLFNVERLDENYDVIETIF